MPNSSGSSSWRERRRTNPAALPRSMKAVATPETRNSSDIRQGLVSSMNGSGVVLAAGLFTCQPQLT